MIPARSGFFSSARTEPENNRRTHRRRFTMVNPRRAGDALVYSRRGLRGASFGVRCLDTVLGCFVFWRRRCSASRVVSQNKTSQNGVEPPYSKTAFPRGVSGPQRYSVFPRLGRSCLMSCRWSLLTVFLVASTASADWKAGVARVRITPEKPMWMSGYAGRDKPAEGTLHDLWARALALEDRKGHRCLLITLDLVGVPRDLSQKVCEAIGKKHSLGREAICLNCSHTHTGPVVRGNLDTMYGLDEKQ